jgi:hypothetical protein
LTKNTGERSISAECGEVALSQKKKKPPKKNQIAGHRQQLHCINGSKLESTG